MRHTRPCLEAVRPDPPPSLAFTSLALTPSLSFSLPAQPYYLARFICDMPLRVGQGLLFGCAGPRCAPPWHPPPVGRAGSCTDRRAQPIPTAARPTTPPQHIPRIPPLARPWPAPSQLHPVLDCGPQPLRLCLLHLLLPGHLRGPGGAGPGRGHLRGCALGRQKQGAERCRAWGRAAGRAAAGAAAVPGRAAGASGGQGRRRLGCPAAARVRARLRCKGTAHPPGPRHVSTLQRCLMRRLRWQSRP